MKILKYQNLNKFSCNTYVFESDDITFIVDPNDETNNIIEFLNNQKLKIDFILITHAHFDHIRGLSNIYSYYKCKIIVSKNDFDFLFDDEVNLSIYDESKFNFKKDNFQKNDFIIINDDTLLNINGLNLKIICTPFHTLGSVCYFLENDEVLFSGDTIFSNGIGRTDLINASDDYKVIKKSLNKLMSLNENIKVYPGHGESFLLKDWKF